MSIRTVVTKVPWQKRRKEGCDICQTKGQLTHVPWTLLAGGGPVDGRWLCVDCKRSREVEA